jgi:hypothetical protein
MDASWKHAPGPVRARARKRIDDAEDRRLEELRGRDEKR